MQKKVLTASAIISELQSSEMYLIVRGQLCDTKTNLNGVRVTESFIDEIVSNESKYQGIPLCADVRGLLNDRTIGHMYNQATGEFMSAIIGSMQSFEKITAEDGTSSLVFTARIMKRYGKVCSALSNLFAEHRLKFSFEICAAKYTEESDGTIVIDADEANYLEGAAVVTFPACEDAVAMELVAECLSKGDDAGMQTNEETVVIEAADEKKVETAEVINTKDSDEEIVAEAQPEEAAENSDAVTAETEAQAEAQTAEQHTETETAETYVCVTQETRETVSTYDTDTGVSTYDTVVHSVSVDGPSEGLMNMPSETASAETAECKDDDDEEKKAECECDEDEDEKKNAESEQTAEAEVVAEEAVAEAEESEDAEPINEIAELRNAIKELKAEIASLAELVSPHEDKANENKSVKAETAEKKWSLVEGKKVIAERQWDLVSPFTSDIAVKPKYSLLEKDKKPEREHYTLI